MSLKGSINIFGMFFYSLVLIIHLIGFALLIQIKSSRRLTAVQRLYLIHLSIIEIYFCLSGITVRVLHLAGSHLLDYYIMAITACGFGVWYFTTMILLTFDRFLAVYLDIKYPSVVSYTRVKFITLISIALAVSLTTVVFRTAKDLVALDNIVYKYAWPTAHAISLIVVIFTYAYLFHRIRYFKNKLKTHIYLHGSYQEEKEEKSSNPTLRHIDHNHNNDGESLIGKTQNQPNVTAPKSSSKEQHQVSSSFYRRKKIELLLRFKRARRGFYLPTLLIATYVLFFILPDLIYFSCRLDGRPLNVRSPTLDAVISLVYIVGILSDAFIYIFGVPKVRQLFIKKLTSLKKRCGGVY